MTQTQQPSAAEAKPLRPAASLLAVRDGSDGLEVMVMKRTDTMRFLPGFLSFPGGSLNPGDFHLEPEWHGSLQGQSLGDDLAYAIGALRETAEETGALLGVCGPDGLARTMTLAPELQDDLLGERLAYASLLGRYNLHMDGRNLRLIGRWITPPFMPARFETRFFVTNVGTSPSSLRVNPAENQWVRWRSPVRLLESIHAKAEKAAPPTIAMLEGMAKYVDAKACFANLEVPGPDPDDPSLRSVLNDL